MKRSTTILFINLVIVLLQLSFFGELFGVGFLPNLVLALSLAYVFNDLKDIPLLSGFLGGLLLDLLGFNIVGISSLLITSLAGLLIVTRRFVSKSWIVNIAYTLFSALVYSRFVNDSSSFFDTVSLTSSFATLLATLVFYFILRSTVDYLRRSGYKLS